MGILAKGHITLSTVNDAYSALLTNSFCVLRGDYDGNVDLRDASTSIKVNVGNVSIPFKCTVFPSDPLISFQVTDTSSYVSAADLKITSIPDDIDSGYLTINLITDDGFSTSVRFSFQVTKDAGMLDWVADWNSNKTQIGDSYIVSPKIFVGKNETSEYIKGLTGVYIGPSETIKKDGVSGIGIFGFRRDKEVFHISNEGASIAGWDIYNDCIVSSGENGTLRLSSSGQISTSDTKGIQWSINSDGSAEFARGKVKFNSDGSAEFSGKIITSSGSIGGWSIGDTTLYNNNIGIDSFKKYVAISKANKKLNSDGTFNGTYLDWVKESGGCAMYWSGDNDYGFASYDPNGKKIFSLGSANKIGGWNINDECIYTGVACNTPGSCTSSPNEITIGTNGLRGVNWRIESDGSASFAKGYFEIASSGDATISGWKLNEESMYLGTNNDDECNVHGAWANENSVVLGTEGIRGYTWRFEKDGSGALADGNISWDERGNVTLSEHVTISWLGDKLTKIDANGVYTGTLVASQVEGLACNFQSGSIGSCGIGKTSIYAGKFNELSDGTTSQFVKTWELNSDGSGFLANNNIRWNTDGEELIINNAQYYGFIGRKPTVITKQNLTKYTKYIAVDGNQVQTINIESCGSWIVFEDGGTGDLAFNGNVLINLRGICVRSLIGSTISIYNTSGANILINGADKTCNLLASKNQCAYITLTPGFHNTSTDLIEGARWIVNGIGTIARTYGEFKPESDTQLSYSE